MEHDQDGVVDLSFDQKNLIVEKKATCPFIGSAVAEGRIAVQGSIDNPLASIEEVRNLGNSGGGNLGEVLVLFAAQRHALMRGASGHLDREVPHALFSLEFPGSKGAHPGHSGILMGDSHTLDSGRLSRADFERLTSRAKNGVVKRSDAGRFIAENLVRDPSAKVNVKVSELLARGFRSLADDLLASVGTIIPEWADKVLAGSSDERTTALSDFGKNLIKPFGGADHLVGSSGEFALLFAFVANKPGTGGIDGEPAVAVEDLEAMFVEKRLPAEFESWKKSSADWLESMAGLALSAAAEYDALKGA